jgi:PPOX class probable F420-dependent enzyme
MQTARTASGVPASHSDLLDRQLPAVLTTQMPDGRWQSIVVWFLRDGSDLLVDTMREFRKARNLSARPRATLLVVDPADERWVEIRARVTPEQRDPLALLDEMGRAYTGVAPYFGRVVPAELAEREHPVAYRLIPVRVNAGPAYFYGSSGHGAGEGAPPVPGPVPAPGGPRSCADEPTIPETHRDLLRRPLWVALATTLPGGGAQTQPVWCSLDGNDVLVNTTMQRREGRNLVADPRATVLAIDPGDSSRWIEIRGDVELTGEGALEHLDRLTEQYTGRPHYYGAIYPDTQRRYETRVIARIHPRRILCDAIHR